MSEYSLSALRVGQSAYVAEIQADEAMRRRLLDLGLIRGTRVTCTAKSPAGDPAAYLIRGAVIALRGRDARGVRLEGLCPERAPAGRTALA
ncbi:ferrous iron transport protein A [Flavonifractor sp. DFI.6.63]|uniref:Ferrous iron transport protein A n=1 Tax=Lawsonibacter hominis TaxID=2763053 RepID=A0A8J6MAM5_9FIRM|nr:MULTISPECIES: FeoA family protein [Oscillospiraceae]MBS1384975.1 ferrous iron transport protein A [Flavonifractor sp.]MDU2196753.1 FeoA family protein [Clostridiales bacterium]MDY2976897.1 FeoA family protein [Oscillospiraceae bacterium]MBC5734029.1 ferrous iron transport protein A [Lawsonibacter hominis]MCI6398674.1 ferrous iron transport protein A [Lawsonibacter sp.]